MFRVYFTIKSKIATEKDQVHDEISGPLQDACADNGCDREAVDKKGQGLLINKTSNPSKRRGLSRGQGDKDGYPGLSCNLDVSRVASGLSISELLLHTLIVWFY